MKRILVIGNETLNKTNMIHSSEIVAEIVVPYSSFQVRSMSILKEKYGHRSMFIEDRITYLQSGFFEKLILWFSGKSARNNKGNTDKKILQYIQGDYESILFPYYTGGLLLPYNTDYCYVGGDLCKRTTKYTKRYFDVAHSMTDNYDDCCFTTINMVRVTETENLAVEDKSGFSEGEINFYVDMFQKNLPKFNKMVNKYKGKEDEIKNFIEYETKKRNGTLGEPKTETFYKKQFTKTNYTTCGDLDKLNFKKIDGVIFPDSGFLDADEYTQTYVRAHLGGFLSSYAFRTGKVEEFVIKAQIEWKTKIKEAILYSSDTTKLRMFYTE